MKSFILTCFIVFTALVVQAQKTARVYYTSDEIATPDSSTADFYLDIQMHGDTLYRYVEYSRAGVRRAEGFANKAVPYLQRHREYTTYYPNLQKRSMGHYHANAPVGIWRKFYQNGNVEEVGVWVKNIRPNESPTRYEVVTYADSVGQLLVEKGNGSFTRYFLNGKIAEMGTYREGLKDSVWTGYFENGDRYYEETYLAGILQSGKSRDKEGRNYSYTIVEDPVSFRQGHLFKLLAGTIKYPPQAQRMGIQGIVMISFLVNQEGIINDLKVHASPHASLTEEAVRALGLTSGGWKPAMLRGQIVAQRYRFPVPFTLL